MSSPRAILPLLAACAALTLIAPSPAGAEWTPGPERYGVGERNNVPRRARPLGGGSPPRERRVGLYGPSYMGLDQFMTAEHLGRHSPLKTLFPIVAGNDTYRDVAFMGGIPDGEFDLLVVFTIFGGLHIVNPAIENPTELSDLIRVEIEHVPGLLSYTTPTRDPRRSR